MSERSRTRWQHFAHLGRVISAARFFAYLSTWTHSTPVAKQLSHDIAGLLKQLEDELRKDYPR